jgi:hypothetical protein
LPESASYSAPFISVGFQNTFATAIKKPAPPYGGAGFNFYFLDIAEEVTTYAPKVRIPVVTATAALDRSTRPVISIAVSPPSTNEPLALTSRTM